jgi:hypothetical protein
LPLVLSTRLSRLSIFGRFPDCKRSLVPNARGQPPSPWTVPFGVARRPFLFRCQIAARCAVSVDWVA